MEDQVEKELNLLKTWMDWKKIPKSDQINYYYKLIAYLEKSKKQSKLRAYTTGIGAGTTGLGIGLLLNSDSGISMCMGGFFILYGVIFGFIPPLKISKPDFKEYNEIEEQRKLIKKWYIANKE